MKYTMATNQTLHTVLFMIEEEQETMLSAQILAEHLPVSVTYLSKKLPQLVKAGLVESVTGANGELYIKKAS